jgi:hypothetical protein
MYEYGSQAIHKLPMKRRNGNNTPIVAKFCKIQRTLANPVAVNADVG